MIEHGSRTDGTKRCSTLGTMRRLEPEEPPLPTRMPLTP